MKPSVRILLPNFPMKWKEIYFTGYLYISKQHLITIYVTKFSEHKYVWNDKKQNENNIILGYSGNSYRNSIEKFTNSLLLDRQQIPQINDLVIHSKKIDSKYALLMLYDYDTLSTSEINYECNDFNVLRTFLSNQHSEPYNITNFGVFLYPMWLSYSMCFQHTNRFIMLLKWLYKSIMMNKKICIKQGNLILAMLTDVILGYIVLQVLSQSVEDVSSLLLGVLERLINLFNSLFQWLMGAPVGLKLNNAFNKMLGKYFSYHIQLWWQFLNVSIEKLDIIFYIYHYFGYLGFSFQVALMSDLISIATFHSYCIYVYAARLFNIQISGLIALLRLFVGRKYNPLRGGIDSCEYTNQELFVGTVAFTILLLLLPTTAMYYTVFTLFRVVSLMVQYALAKLIYLIQSLPLYVSLLWLINSPKVAGDIRVEVTKASDEDSPLVLNIKLQRKPIYLLLNLFQPPADVQNNFQWANLLSNILVGKQIA